MKIITVPHSTLRTVAQPVVTIDKKVLQFIQNLQTTLAKKDNPKGVGLAAPQVDMKWRIFVTQLSPDGGRSNEEKPPVMRTFINPRIIDRPDKLTFGPDKREPILEGCLSIPGIYGPVPRWPWLRLEFQEIVNGELVIKTERFSDFAARVIQHENDHLDGVLFVDYALEYDLPLYKEDPKTEKLQEIDPQLVPSFVASTK
jgi:peptide deformylase